MSDYTVTTDFSVKDSLASGNSEKTILGADVDVEFDAIATAIATKVDDDSIGLTTNNVLCQHKGLVVKYVSASTVDLDATEVVLTDGSGSYKVYSSLNETLDITNSGANGLDTGSESSATPTWYYIWAIGKTDGTLDGILSTSSTIGSLTFPSGYTYAGLCGAVHNGADDDFDRFYQVGSNVTIASVEAVNDSSATTVTAADLSAVVPATATGAYVLISARRAANTNAVGADVYTDSSGNYLAARHQIEGGSTTTFSRSMAHVPIATAQTLYYAVDSGVSGRLSLSIYGYTY